MSVSDDIRQDFDELITKYPELKADILTCKFNVYESLNWENATKEVGLYILI